MGEISEQENSVLVFLVEAWNEFVKLDSTHPSDTSEFQKAIHDAQKIIALRIARRFDPEVWMIDEEKSL